MTRPKAAASDPIRTKIVATLGPASNSREVIKGLIQAGTDVFRLNFSHGTHDQHRALIDTIRSFCPDPVCPYAVLGDLSGPKLRLGDIEGACVNVEEGQRLELTSSEADGTGGRFHVSIPNFEQLVQPGQKIMLDDGKIQFLVEEIKADTIHCLVLDGGPLCSRKGVNLPDTDLPFPALTGKDHEDMEFAIEAGVDLLALSFVRSPRDILEAKEAMRKLGGDVPLLAKIEKRQAVERLDEILQAADGAMVARGDLGIEIPMEQVPNVQKRIIHQANRVGKPVITATQMLESMMTNPRPTRAEIADIYNAILDGTDAVMLSGETAAGEHPVRAVQVMRRVAAEAEKSLTANKGLDWILEPGEEPNVTHVTCNSAVMMAERMGLDLILVPTQSGYSAHQVSRFKPHVPVIAVSTDRQTVMNISLAWGVTGHLMESVSEEEAHRNESDAVVAEAVRVAKATGFARPGMQAVVIGGAPYGSSPHTNYLRIIDIE